jgi:hypothetical protein
MSNTELTQIKHGAVDYMNGNCTAEQVRASELYQRGDCINIWVNQGEFEMLGLKLAGNRLSVPVAKEGEQSEWDIAIKALQDVDSIAQVFLEGGYGKNEDYKHYKKLAGLGQTWLRLKQAKPEADRIAELEAENSRLKGQLAALGESNENWMDGFKSEREHSVKLEADIAALRAQIQPQGEVVAYGFPNTAITGAKHSLMMVRLEIPSDDQYPQNWIPLFTSPQGNVAQGEAVATLVKSHQGVRLSDLRWFEKLELPNGNYPLYLHAQPANNASVDELVDIIQWILPMARGYAANHDVGANYSLIQLAEEALAKHRKEG